MPTLKPFLDSLESGQMNAGDVHQTKSQNTGSHSNYYSGLGSQQRGRNSKIQYSNATHGSNGVNHRKMYEMEDVDAAIEKKMGTLASATAGCTSNDAAWDEKGHASQTVLIQQTWRVDVESNSTSESETDTA